MAETKKNEVNPGQGTEIGKIYSWLKGIESKVNNLRSEVEIIRDNLSNKFDKLDRELKTINSDVLELKRESSKTQEKMDLIIKELRLTSSKDEVMVLKKYMDMWNPMNFVTQRDVERLVEQKLEEKEN
ncbi:hypothetical protein HOC13_00740 [Candidatus Woesearchaeota archaeon]|jgi:hypothetical protein|nr:hypothetical protein [Candidatus Woesearchaeota archaeon]